MASRFSSPGVGLAGLRVLWTDLRFRGQWPCSRASFVHACMACLRPAARCGTPDPTLLLSSLLARRFGSVTDRGIACRIHRSIGPPGRA